MSRCSRERYLCGHKRGNLSPLSKYRGFSVFSMKMFISGAKIRQVDWAAAEHLLSPFSSPFFGVKLLYDFGFRRLYHHPGRSDRSQGCNYCRSSPVAAPWEVAPRENFPPFLRIVAAPTLDTQNQNRSLFSPNKICSGHLEILFIITVKCILLYRMLPTCGTWSS